MSIEDRVRDGLQQQATQIQPYKPSAAGIRERGVQRRRRVQGATAGVLAVGALFLGNTILAGAGREGSTETIVAVEPDDNSVEEAQAVPTPAPLEEAEAPADAPGALNASLPDLLSIENGQIINRGPDGSETVLAAAAPGSARLVAFDRLSGYVQFGDDDIHWTPGPAAPPELITEISAGGAESEYSRQRLVPGDVFLSGVAKWPAVVYGVEREREGAIVQQQVIRRDLLTDSSVEIWAAGEGTEVAVRGPIRQISVGGATVAVVHDGPTSCSVQLFTPGSEAVGELDVAACPRQAYGSLSPDGSAFAWAGHDGPGGQAGVVSVPSGQDLADGSINAELQELTDAIAVDFDGRFLAIPRGDDTLLIDTADGADPRLTTVSGSSTITAAPASAGSDSVSVERALRPADAQTWSDTACPRTDEAVITLRRAATEDESGPDCFRVGRGQRLVLHNDGEDDWDVEFAHIDVTIEPGRAHAEILPLGAFLEPGVHLIDPEPSSGAMERATAVLWFDP